MFTNRLVSIKRAICCLCYIGIVLATFHTVRTNFHGDKLLEQGEGREEQELYADNGHNYSVENSKIAQDDWNCIRKDFCVYSAHYDNTTIDRPTVRVFGVGGPRNAWNMFTFCQYMGTDGVLSQLIPAEARTMPSFDSVNHTSFSLLCNLDENWETVRVVLLNPTLRTEESIYLRIHYPPPVYKYQVAICVVNPFHSRFNRTIRLLEWIEYYRMLGVQHFTFYNYSATKEVGEILNSYDPNIATSLPWGMDMVDNGIAGYGQFFACTECAHRYRGVTKYLIGIDVDELYVLPSMFNNFYDYLEHLWNEAESDVKKTVNSLIFYSRASYNNWEPDDSGHLLRKLGKGPRLHKVLEEMIIPFRTRYLPAGQMKFIMKPDLVTISSVHLIGEGTANTTDVHVPLHKGYYLHVRDCTPDHRVPNGVLENNATCLQTTGIRRDTYLTERFGMNLLRLVAAKIESTSVLRRIFDVDQ